MPINKLNENQNDEFVIDETSEDFPLQLEKSIAKRADEAVKALVKLRFECKVKIARGESPVSPEVLAEVQRNNASPVLFINTPSTQVMSQVMSKSQDSEECIAHAQKLNEAIAKCLYGSKMHHFYEAWGKVPEELRKQVLMLNRISPLHNLAKEGYRDGLRQLLGCFSKEDVRDLLTRKWCSMTPAEYAENQNKNGTKQMLVKMKRELPRPFKNA